MHIYIFAKREEEGNLQEFSLGDRIKRETKHSVKEREYAIWNLWFV